MKKLRLTSSEWEEMLKDISLKFHENHNRNLNEFEYTKKDVEEFVKELVQENVKKPTILINSNTYTKMYELVRQSPIELQWHMMVKRFPETQEYHVYDILLFPQTNSGASTTTDQDEFAEWQANLIQDLTFPIEELRGHGHSHVNMGVYSSGVDDAYQRNLITKVDDGDFYLFFVLNKKMELFALLYDFEQQIIFETKDMTIEIIDDDGVDIRTWCEEQIKTYCKKAETKVATYKPPNKKDQRDEYISTMLPNETQVKAFWERR